MEENKDFDMESIVDELSLSLEQLIEDTLSEQIEPFSEIARISSRIAERTSSV